MASEAKQKRLAILRQINRLEKERCETCGGMFSYSNHSVYCDCEAAVVIRKLGEELEAISNDSRQKRIQHLLHTLKKNGLSVEVYDSLKDLDVHDKRIFQYLGMAGETFRDWKFSIGKMKKRRFQEKQVKKKAPTEKRGRKKKNHIEQKYIDIAAANGITKEKLFRRVFVDGWELKRATTEPVQARKNDFNQWRDVAEQHGISIQMLKDRVGNGEPIEEAAVRPKGEKRKKETAQ